MASPGMDHCTPTPTVWRHADEGAAPGYTASVTELATAQHRGRGRERAVKGTYVMKTATTICERRKYNNKVQLNWWQSPGLFVRDENTEKNRITTAVGTYPVAPCRQTPLVNRTTAFRCCRRGRRRRRHNTQFRKRRVAPHQPHLFAMVAKLNNAINNN